MFVLHLLLFIVAIWIAEIVYDFVFYDNLEKGIRRLKTKWWRRKRFFRSEDGRIVGIIDEVADTDYGIRASGRVNPETYKMMLGDQIKHLSIGMQADPKPFQEAMSKVRIASSSLYVQPKKKKWWRR